MTPALLALQQRLFDLDQLQTQDGRTIACEITADGLLWLNSSSDTNLHDGDQLQLLLAPASPGSHRPLRLAGEAHCFTLVQAQHRETLLAQPALATPWPAARADSMVQHMNQDHADAVRHYFQLKGHSVSEATLLSVDPFGMWLSGDQQILRFSFSAPALEPVALRETLVALARTPI